MSPFEPTRLQATLDAAGPAFVTRMRDVFARSVREKTNDLRDAVATGDAEGAHRAAHSIKGSAATVGLTALQHLAQDLERQARDAPGSVTLDALAPLDAALEDGLAAMDAWIAETVGA